MRALENNELASIAGGLMKNQSVANGFGIAGAMPNDNSGEPQDIPTVQVNANISSSFAGDPFGLWGSFSSGSTGTISPPGEFDKIGKGEDPGGDNSSSDWKVDGDIHADPNSGLGVDINADSDANDLHLTFTLAYNLAHDSMYYEAKGSYRGTDVDYSHDFHGNQFSFGHTLPNGIHLSVGQSIVGNHKAVMLKASVPLN